MRNSSPIRPWRKPRDDVSPSRAAVRSSSSPRTLTYTRAARRSGLVSTEVTVTNPMRGSLRPWASSEDSTSLTASLTRRIRAPAILVKLLAGKDRPLDSYAVGELRLHVAAELGARVVHDRGRPAHERGRQRRPLPEVVVVGLGDRRAEAPLELRLQRHDLLPLALQAPVVREVKVNLDQADEAHGRALAATRAPSRPAASRRPRRHRRP